MADDEAIPRKPMGLLRFARNDRREKNLSTAFWLVNISQSYLSSCDIARSSDLKLSEGSAISIKGIWMTFAPVLLNFLIISFA